MCLSGPKRRDHSKARRPSEGAVSGGSDVRPSVSVVLHEGSAEGGNGQPLPQSEELDLRDRLNNPLAAVLLNLDWIKDNVHPEDEEMHQVVAETIEAANLLKDRIQEEINVRRRSVDRTR